MVELDREFPYVCKRPYFMRNSSPAWFISTCLLDPISGYACKVFEFTMENDEQETSRHFSLSLPLELSSIERNLGILE